MSPEEAYKTRRARWKELFKKLHQRPQREAYDEVQLKILAEGFTNLFNEAYRILEGCAYEISGTINVPSLRSTDGVHSNMLKVKSEEVQEFVNFLSDLKAVVDQHVWNEAERPNIFIDLSAVHVDGPLVVRFKGNYLVTNATEFLSTLRIEIHDDANVRFVNTQFRRGFLAVWLASGKFSLSDDGNSYHEEIWFQGVKAEAAPKREPQRCVLEWTHARPSNAFGAVKITDCDIEALRFDRWSFDENFIAGNTIFRVNDFLSCDFRGGAIFLSCHFVDQPVRFLNSTFPKPLAFLLTDFNKAPDFHGVKFHPNTKFKDCRFVAAGSLFGSSCTPADVASYRVLKGHFSQQKDSRQEIVFYALEQRAERSVGTSDPVETALSWFQDAVCGYGQSLSRAVIVFALWNGIFGAIFQMLPGSFLSVKSKGSIADYPGVALSLQNAFNPLALFSDKGLVELHSLWMYSASLIQALGSIGIVALIILTIRGKFRKGSSSES